MSMWQKDDIELESTSKSEEKWMAGARDFDGHIEKLTHLAELYYPAGSSSSDHRLHTVINHMKDAVILIDSELKVLEINQAALNIAGLCKDQDDQTLQQNQDLVALTFFDHSHLSRCMRGEHIKDLLVECMQSDGVRCQIIFQGTPIYGSDGQVEMALFVGRDITELKELQKRTQKMLSEMSRHESSLRHLINNIPAGVLLLDSDLRLLRRRRLAPHPRGQLLDL